MIISKWHFIRKDLYLHFSSLKYLPRWVVFLVDLFAVVVSFSIALFIGSQLKIGAEAALQIERPFSWPSYAFIMGQVFFFWLFHTYSGILRYSGFVDAAKLLIAVFSNVLLFTVVNLISIHCFDTKIYQFVTLISYGILAFFCLFIIRLVVKNTFDFISANSSSVIPVMIYGTKSAGTSIAEMIRSNEKTPYKLVGFVDTDKEVKSKVLMGVKVYQLNEHNVKKIIARKARAVIVSPMKMETINPKKDLDIFINNGILVLTIPPISPLNNSAPSVRQIKSIEIDDLLERPQITISTDNISAEIKDKVVLITGAAGSIGSEIVKQTINFNPEMIVLVDQAETPMHELTLKMKSAKPGLRFSAYLGDIRNQERMEQMMELYRPDIIFHAAAYKHVPLMEDNPTESIQTNIMGTKIMADLAVKYNVSRFVMVSTDKAVNPTNVMGASKRIAEIYVQSLNNHLVKEGKTSTKFITTRFGNVLGSNGSVIPLFKKQIENKGPVTVTHPDIIRYFMTIPEACLLVLEAGTAGNGGEIYIFDMGEPVKILDLAKKMIRLAGYKPNIDIPIKFIGLRPGEKLYEELLNSKEATKKTHHPKIMIATVREYDYREVSEKISELIKFSAHGKNFLSVSQMKEIVPEYVSNNSEYERLDLEKELTK